MLEIDEKDILCCVIDDAIVSIYGTMHQKYGKNNFCSDFLSYILTIFQHEYIFENEIETFYIPNTVEVDALEELLMLVKQKMYKFGLRIIKDDGNEFMYIYLDEVINDKPYYVDNIEKYDEIKKLLGEQI